MEEQYTSVALMEYMGEDYPDADAADSGSCAAPELLDQEAVTTTDGVELWEQTKSTLVSVSCYRNSNVVTPYSDNAVIVASGVYHWRSGYDCAVSRRGVVVGRSGIPGLLSGWVRPVSTDCRPD